MFNKQLGWGWFETSWCPDDVIANVINWSWVENCYCWKTPNVSSWIQLLTLQWRHNEGDVSDNVSHRRHLPCLLNWWFKRRSKKSSKLHVTGFCEGNSPVTGEFPAQRLVTWKMFPFEDVIMCYLNNGNFSTGKTTSFYWISPSCQHHIFVQKGKIRNWNGCCFRSYDVLLQTFLLFIIIIRELPNDWRKPMSKIVNRQQSVPAEHELTFSILCVVSIKRRSFTDIKIPNIKIMGRETLLSLYSETCL